jgi:hypothetical protein
MIDSTFIPPPPVPADARKQSKIGIASFVIGIVAMLIFCVALLLAFGYGFMGAAQTPGFTIDSSSPIILGLGLVMCISPLLSLVGLGLGIAALVQKNDKKLFAGLGLALNLLIVLIYCLLAVVGLMGQFGSTAGVG